MDAAVLDLVADDSTGLQKQKSVYHWDKRGKKYVKLNNGERVTASGKAKGGTDRNFQRHKKQKSIPNANVRNELRDVEQVRKQRQKKATKQILSFKKKGPSGKAIKGGKGAKVNRGSKGGNSGKKAFRGKGKKK